MPDAPTPISQATNDELAALYLRDRDTPCPSCNYNRRDGTTSTCPECGEQLRLIGVNKTGRSREYEILKALLLVLLIFVIIELFQNSLTLARWLYITIGSGIGALPPRYLVIKTIIVITWMTLLIFVIRRRRALRNDVPTSTKRVIVPIVVLLGINYLIKTSFVIMMIL